MSTLITIDPGNATGVAIWDGLELQAAFLIKTGRDLANAGHILVVELGTARGLDIFGLDALIERPHEQARRVKVDSLIALSLRAGSYAGALSSQGCSVDWIKPSTWKGTIRKPLSVKQPYIVAERVKARLSREELARIEWPRAVSERWDVIDALGIGIVVLGRAGRGVV